MRKQSFERLLAGTMLAAIVATPAISIAAPDRLQSVGPMPPSLNSQAPRRREAAPVPPPTGYTPPAIRAVPGPRARRRPRPSRSCRLLRPLPSNPIPAPPSK